MMLTNNKTKDGNNITSKQTPSMQTTGKPTTPQACLWSICNFCTRNVKSIQDWLEREKVVGEGGGRGGVLGGQGGGVGGVSAAHSLSKR